MGRPKRGADQADYLTRQALTLEGTDREILELAKSLVADRISYDDAIEKAAKLILQDAATEYQDRLTGLRTAVAAVGETGYIEAVDRIAALHPMDDEAFQTLSEGLRTAFEAAGQHGYAEALDGVIDARMRVNNPVDAEDRAIQRLQQAEKRVTDPEFIRNHEIRLREGTDPRLLDRLGVLPGAVPDQETVRRLMSSQTASGSMVPGRRYRKEDHRSEPTAFIELVFSAGKSISVTKAFAPSEERQVVQEAHRRAVDHALTKVEDRIAKVWVRDKSGTRFEKADIIWIVFDHQYSRTGKPQIHSHVAILNVSQSRESDRVGPLCTAYLHGQFREIRASYHQALARNLVEAGFPARYDVERLEARIDQIPERVLRAFSDRTTQAEDNAKDWAKRHDIDYDRLSDHQKSRLRTGGAAYTRKPEFKAQPDPNEWRRIAEAAGWKPAISYLTDTGKAIQQTQNLTQQVKERTPEQRKHWRENRLWQRLTQALNQRHGGGRRGQYLEEEESSQRLRR